MKFTEIFKDDNTWNEKAIIGFIAFIVMILVMIVDVIATFLGKHFYIDPNLYNSFLFLVLGSFGISGIEKVFNKKSNENK